MVPFSCNSVVNCIKFGKLVGYLFEVFWLKPIKQTKLGDHRHCFFAAYHARRLVLVRCAGWSKK